MADEITQSPEPAVLGLPRDLATTELLDQFDLSSYSPGTVFKLVDQNGDYGTYERSDDGFSLIQL